jgi:hypothetical protein
MPKAFGILSWRTDSVRTIFRAVEVCKLIVSDVQTSPFREIFNLNEVENPFWRFQPLLVAFEGEMFHHQKKIFIINLTLK